MIRVAAVGDLHYDRRSRGRLESKFKQLGRYADLLLIAGDLTQAGYPEEAEALASDLASADVPVFAVFGNHDFHQDADETLKKILQRSGVRVLEGDSATIDVHGSRVGVIGLKGFGGGFVGASCSEFGEPEIKAFARHAREQAEILERGLLGLECDFRFVLTHYSPIEATLEGERREIYPFLGSYLLARAIDRAGANAAFHGHAHLGQERGATPGGVPVRNVALPVIRHAYQVYAFERGVRRAG